MSNGNDVDYREEVNPASELSPMQVLRASEDAQVVKAVWWRQFSCSSSAIRVTVKMLREDLALNSHCVGEKRPSWSPHPNLIKCYEVTAQAPYTIVSECCDGGRLYETLQDVKFQLSWPLRAKILHDVSKGLEHIHGHSQMHRDVRSHNVHLAHLNRNMLKDSILPLAKLDCSLPGLGPMHSAELEKGVECLKWMAPELLGDLGQYDQTCDVYSFGILMFEVLSRRDPYADQWSAFTDQSGFNIINGNRPTLELVDEGCPRTLLLLMQECWHPNPAVRPSMSRIRSLLQSQIESV
eukprot:TRINITY_DN16011_c0_g1_i2.p1 TRINITY_DN16011_c0_g1~~TRINITY_DN16011_c0_g1_i2.p1  ORF type:complete len:295 (+),score=34.32 TRINITY_DN16011_c0_g1_i2:60-944(+)